MEVRALVSLSAALLVLAGCGAGSEVAAGGPELGTSAAALSSASAPVCPGPAQPGSARCNAWVRLNTAGLPYAASGHGPGNGKGPGGGGGGGGGGTPPPPSNGLTPANLQAAYGLPSATAGSGQTIAIVDAYDDPNAEADMNVYRAAYGLPACTTASGCFKKVNQSGVQGSYPRKDGGWALEISLDLDMASAICPNCNVLLVEADSPTMANLGASVNTAVALGATVVSNSYGGGEYSGETQDELTYFDHPGVAITVSAGDSGYGVEFPAASQFVTAVGGTSLTTATNARGWSETAWSGTGSGCSQYVTKPSWQTDAGCGNRTVGDVSAVADPSTGVTVYDSFKYQGQSGWFIVGGTSASSPIIGAVYALAGNTSSLTYGSAPYSGTNFLNDVTSGSNGSCGGSYLCTATGGYDGPTGLGTPDGTGAF